MSDNTGVERTFPINSPNIESIEAVSYTHLCTSGTNLYKYLHILFLVQFSFFLALVPPSSNLFYLIYFAPSNLKKEELNIDYKLCVSFTVSVLKRVMYFCKIILT